VLAKCTNFSFSIASYRVRNQISKWVDVKKNVGKTSCLKLTFFYTNIVYFVVIFI